LAERGHPAQEVHEHLVGTPYSASRTVEIRGPVPWLDSSTYEAAVTPHLAHMYDVRLLKF
jgi:hypothetical protein